jgi:hypothetical protein
LGFTEHTQLGTQYLVVLSWNSNQLVAEAAAYTTTNKDKRQTSILSAAYKPVIPAIEWPQNYAFYHMATSAGKIKFYSKKLHDIHDIVICYC